MGCFTSKASHKQLSYNEEKSGETNDDKTTASAFAKSHESQLNFKEGIWWEINGDKITASALAEILFYYPSEFFDWMKRPVEKVDNSIMLPLLLAFQDAVSIVREQPHTVEECDLSMITKIMKATGRFLRPIDVLLPKLLADQNVSCALREAGLDATMVKKEFYDLHYTMQQEYSSYETVRKYCYDFLLESARHTNTIVDWVNEIRDLTVTLSMDCTNAVILVGEPGIDKVAVVEGLAQSMLQGRLLTSFFDRCIVALDMGALAYRDKGKGLDEIIVDIWHELRSSDTKIVIFIDDIAILFHDDAARTILRYNIRRDRVGDRVQCIGTMTSDQYYKYIDGDAGLCRMCDIMIVKDSSQKNFENNF